MELNNINRFIIKLGLRVFLLYALWLLLFRGLQFIWPAYHTFQEGFENMVLDNLMWSVIWFTGKVTDLDIVGKYDTIFYNNFPCIIIDKTCLGIKLISIFIIFIIAYPGGTWRSKLWFIPAGILVLHFVNIIRVNTLSLIMIYNPDLFGIVHGFGFRVLFYGTTFVMWFIWMKYFVKMDFFNTNVKVAASEIQK